MRKVIKEISFPGVRGKLETVTMYEPDKGSNTMEIAISTDKKLTRVQFRNVGAANPTDAIQFSMSEYSRDTNRTKHLSFSIPQELAELFLSHLNTVK